MKQVAGLVTLVITLSASSLNAEIPSPFEYKNWPIQEMKGDNTRKYRINDQIAAQVVVEIDQEINIRGQIIPIIVTFFAQKSNPNPKENPLEFGVRRVGKYQGSSQLPRYLSKIVYYQINNNCGQCHPIVEK